MITAFLILALLSNLSGIITTTTQDSTIYFCSNSLCLVPSPAPSSIQVNQTFYLYLYVNIGADEYIQNTQVGFQTDGQTIVQASNQIATQSGKNYITFGLTYPNISSNVRVNIYGNLVAANIFISNPGYVVNATTSSFAVTNYANIIMASSLLAFILAV